MPSTSSVAAPSEENRLKSALEGQGVKFHIKAGNAKWACTILDRATHERKKASTQTTSSSSSSTTETKTASK